MVRNIFFSFIGYGHHFAIIGVIKSSENRKPAPKFNLVKTGKNNSLRKIYSHKAAVSQR